MTERSEDALDRVIESGAGPGDAEFDNLARAAAELQEAFSVEAPRAADVQAMFVEGVAAATARPPYRRLIGGFAVAGIVLLAVVMASRDALPGHTLYSVRQALDSVGLADSPAREAARRLDKAASLIEAAEAMPPSERAQILAVDAIGELGVVRELAEGIESDEAATEVIARAARLEQRAARVIAASGFDESDGVGEDRAENNDRSGRDEGPGEDTGGEDRSGTDDGPGGGDDGLDDSTGSGGGDGGSRDGGGGGHDGGGDDGGRGDGGGDDRSGEDDGGSEDDTDDGDRDDSSGPGGGDDGSDDGGSGEDDDHSETESSGPGSDDAEDASND